MFRIPPGNSRPHAPTLGIPHGRAGPTNILEAARSTTSSASSACLCSREAAIPEQDSMESEAS